MVGTAGIVEREAWQSQKFNDKTRQTCQKQIYWDSVNWAKAFTEN